MSARQHGRPYDGGARRPSAAAPLPLNPTYSAIASLRDQLRSTKASERRAAVQALLAKLHDTNTPRRLEREAARGFAAAPRGGRGEAAPLLPRDRVCVLYRGLLDAALLAARTADMRHAYWSSTSPPPTLLTVTDSMVPEAHPRTWTRAPSRSLLLSSLASTVQAAK